MKIAKKDVTVHRFQCRVAWEKHSVWHLGGHVHLAPLIRPCDGRIKKGGQGRKMEGRVSEKWDVEGEDVAPSFVQRPCCM